MANMEARFINKQSNPFDSLEQSVYLDLSRVAPNQQPVVKIGRAHV